MKEIFMPNIENPKQIPESELRIVTARSGGKGGQNVNKRETKVQIFWNVGASNIFTEEEKERIRYALGNKISGADELKIESQEERTQEDNRRIGIERLNRVVASALHVDAERIPTKPTAGSQERRLSEKEHRGKIKEFRKKVDY